MRAEAVTGQDYGLGLHVVFAETVTGQDYGHGRFRTRLSNLLRDAVERIPVVRFRWHSYVRIVYVGALYVLSVWDP